MKYAGLMLARVLQTVPLLIWAHQHKDLPMHINLFALFEGNISCGDLVCREHKDKGGDVTHQSTAIARYR